MANHDEVLMSFFQNYNMVPKWENCNGLWGHIDPELGEWVGAIGKINKGEADIAVGGLLGCNGDRSTVARCVPPMGM